MCTLPLRFIKERNKVSTASAYCLDLEQRRAWLIVDGISVKTDKTIKESRDRARVKESKKVKGDDAERQLAKQRQRMANHRARER